MATVIEPPLGVMPKRLWDEDRMRNLLWALERNIVSGRITQTVLEWSQELTSLLQNYVEEEE